MACYFVEAAPHGDAVCTLMNLCLPAWEHMDREAEERMERHESEGQSQASSRCCWQWDRGRWGKLEGRGGVWSSEREAQLWLMFSIYFCPPLLVSGFPSPHRLGRCEVFSPLCCYQEIIICCSVFHTDNQHYSEQQNKLPHGGVQKYTNKTSVYNILSMRLYLSCSYNWLAEHISSIIYRLCQE